MRDTMKVGLIQNAECYSKHEREFQQFLQFSVLLSLCDHSKSVSDTVINYNAKKFSFLNL